VRAVVDTNVWVSALLNPVGGPAGVRHALADRRFTLISSEPLLVELTEVLARPRIAERYRLNKSDAAELTALLRERGEVVSVTGQINSVEIRMTTS